MTTKAIIKGVASALLLCATAAHADNSQRWQYVGDGSGGASVSVLKENLLAGRADQRDARMWVLFDARKVTASDVYQVRSLVSVDCVAHTYRKVSTSIMYKDGTSSTNLEYGSALPVVPDSPMEIAVGLLCKTGGPA